VPGSRRVNRIRTTALVVLLTGAVLMVLVGMSFPAQVALSSGTTVKVTDYTKSPGSGESAFNWLFALLVMGPAVVTAAVLYGAAEIAAAVRRGGRSRSHDRADLEVGDEV
jgi:hypothetical protein